MGQKDIYQYYCEVEKKYIKQRIIVGNPAPTVCKNSGHNITASSISIKHKAPRADYIGLGNVSNIKDNTSATRSPGLTDDVNSGYSIGSRWVHPNLLLIWICMDASVGAADWTQLNVSGGGLSSASNIGSGVGLFKQKIGSVLQLYSLDAGSDKISISQNSNSINIDLVESNISISNLGGGPTGSVVGTIDTQSLSNKTFVSPVLTIPQINDTSSNHKYIFAVNELTANRIITLPLLESNDTFVFENATQTLSNKTLSGPIVQNNLITNGSYIEFSDMSAPSAPGSGLARLYKKTGSSGLFWRPDSSSEIDITSGGVSRKCDVYYKPLSGITSFSSNWTDVPMHVERTIDENFYHSINSAEITINTTDTYMIIAKCSGYNTTNTRSASQIRIVRDTGGGYNHIAGSVAYMYHRYGGLLGYETTNIPMIISLNAGDKIKMQIQKIEGATTLYIPSEAASIIIKNV